MTSNDLAKRLLTTTEIAELAGVSQSAVSNWTKRHADFPDSLKPTIPIYDRAAIIAWLLDHGKVQLTPIPDVENSGVLA